MMVILEINRSPALQRGLMGHLQPSNTQPSWSDPYMCIQDSLSISLEKVNLFDSSTNTTHDTLLNLPFLNPEISSVFEPNNN